VLCASYSTKIEVNELDIVLDLISAVTIVMANIPFPVENLEHLQCGMELWVQDADNLLSDQQLSEGVSHFLCSYFSLG